MWHIENDRAVPPSVSDVLPPDVAAERRKIQVPLEFSIELSGESCNNRGLVYQAISAAGRGGSGGFILPLERMTLHLCSIVKDRERSIRPRMRLLHAEVPMPKLSISRRHEFFNWVPLDPEKVEGYRLGRGRQADIKLSGHTDISREHARIFYNPEEDQWYLVDQSLFGTFLNGQRIPEKVPVKLNYGDSIRIHDYLLIFNMESSIFVADVSNVYDSPLPLRENSKFEHLISQLSERMGQLSHDGAFFVRYVAETVRRSFHVDNCFVGIYDEGGNHFEHFYNDSSDPALQGRKFRPSESFLAAVRNERRALSSLDVSNDPEFKNFETLARSRVRSAVGIPILGNAGVLYLDSRLSTLQHCTDEDLDFLCSLCGANGIIGFLVNTLRQIHDVHEEVLIPFSPQLSEIVDEIYRNVARAQGHVLILGESGTGKELAARLIHRYSERANRPFLSFNCTAVPATLFDDAFFGHDKGSFTDANGPRKGYYESALGGTL
ncbi:MAG: FHA domain-containing protein, partial [Deltaproteobacteria bacterium]